MIFRTIFVKSDYSAIATPNTVVRFTNVRRFSSDLSGLSLCLAVYMTTKIALHERQDTEVDIVYKVMAFVLYAQTAFIVWVYALLMDPIEYQDLKQQIIAAIDLYLT